MHSRVLLTLHEEKTHDVSRVPYNSIKHERDVDHVLYGTIMNQLPVHIITRTVYKVQYNK